MFPVLPARLAFFLTAQTSEKSSAITKPQKKGLLLLLFNYLIRHGSEFDNLGQIPGLQTQVKF